VVGVTTPGAKDVRGSSDGERLGVRMPDGQPAGAGSVPLVADGAGWKTSSGSRIVRPDATVSGWLPTSQVRPPRLYARYRRDLPPDQARAVAEQLGLSTDDVVIDLGCGTGQLAVPLRDHCAGVIAVDPEPAMLAGLRGRDAPGVLCVLAADRDLVVLRGLLAAREGVGAVVIGNALHWMDEPVALSRCAELLRRRGGMGVITQGPPMWLGPAPWQQGTRRVLEEFFGPVTSTCGTDTAALESRVRALEELGLGVRVTTWSASYEVDVDWVIGHLGSALPSDALRPGVPGGLADALQAQLGKYGNVLVEEVTTTAVVARRLD
jgi:SAM-dependent methyltransferase